QDAYTTASTYPYSRPAGDLGSGIQDDTGVTEGGVDPASNYLRNSVKITVDGYDGTVTLYAMDETEPILRCYRQAFPGLFRPASEMPPTLRAHLRYPEDLLRLQALTLNRFHVTSPDVFYGQSDVWEIPTELLTPQQGAAAME